MNNIHDKYQFFISVGLTPDQQVWPCVDDVIFSYETDDDLDIFQVNITSELLFRNDYKNNRLDFDFLKQLEANNLCDEVVLIVNVKCGGVFQPYRQFLINLKKANYDNDRCEVRISTDPFDELTCIKKNWNEKKNIISLAKDLTVSSSQQGVVETQTRTQVIPAEDLPQGFTPPIIVDTNIDPNEGWTVIEASGRFLFDDSNGDGIPDEPPNFRYSATTVWAREVLNDFPCSTNGDVITPLGGGWILLADNCAIDGTTDWARALGVVLTTSIPNPNNYFFQWTSIDEIQQQFGPAISFQSILNFLNDCPITFQSNFFNINPQGTNPNNIAYTESVNHHNLGFYQKSDIKRPDATQAATIGLMSLKELLTELQLIYDLQFGSVTGSLIIEHNSFFTKTLGLDLTQPQYAQYVKGLAKYTYTTEDIPKFEEFNWMDETDEDFDFATINYENNCVNPDQTNNYGSSIFNPNIGYIVANPDGIEDKGFVIAAFDTDGTDFFFRIVDGALNGDFKRSVLVDNFYQNNRYFLDARIGNDPVTFESTRPDKRQEPIEIPFCCEDLLAFDPNNEIRTSLGDGELEKAEFSAKSSTMTLTLLHP